MHELESFSPLFHCKRVEGVSSPFTHVTGWLMLLDPGIRLNLAMWAAAFYGIAFGKQEGGGAGAPASKPGVKGKSSAVAA